jgi:hypothetical protein
MVGGGSEEKGGNKKNGEKKVRGLEPECTVEDRLSRDLQICSFAIG